MSDLKDDIKLAAEERGELVIQAGLQLIPFGIGSSLSSLYFGAKLEKRFKRLELFYQELGHEIRKMLETDARKIRDNLELISEENKEYLSFLMEEINEKIEREYIEDKLNYFKNYFINILLNPVLTSNFDEKRFFLDCLGLISLLECELLVNIYNQNQSVEALSLQRDEIDKFALVGSINRLKNYGFLVSIAERYTMENPLNELLRLTNFGRKFCEFCLKP